MISTIDRPLVNNTSSPSSKSSSSSPGTPLSSSRRPSYVGLSKSVSGYSTLYKYSASEDRRGPAASIPVSKDPQTLNAMRQEFHCSTHVSTHVSTHHNFTGSSSSALRESSPGSDSNSSSSSNSATNCGNLVQKQIERLYGGKLTPAALKSPPRYSSNSNQSSPAGKDTTDQVSKSPLELKVPAVFRLLRPEFREQLKMHSCTVEIPDERLSKKERIIPITKIQETRKAPPRERIIPIQREDAGTTPSSPGKGKPALPAKPSSPVRIPPVSSPPPVTQPEEQPPAGLVEDGASDEDETGHLVGGLRERELLCTIVEEDNESTASGYTAPRSNGHPRPVHHRRPSDEGRAEPTVEEEAMDLLPKKDGHYFIKLIENEVFKFEEQICDFEEDLCNNEALMNEDVRESILAAIGKAKLLMGQKLAQFRGLCDRNINSSVESDPFVPTSDDLAGFWDMVYIQVEHIHSLFAELVDIRKNGWKKPELEVAPLKTNGSSSSSSSQSNKESRPVKKKKTPSSAKPKSNIAKARDEARRKMLEEKKKELMKKKAAEATSSPISSENGVLMFI